MNRIIALIFIVSGCATTQESVEVKSQQCPDLVGAPWANPLKVDLTDLDTDGPAIESHNLWDAFSTTILLTDAKVTVNALPVTQAAFRKIARKGGETNSGAIEVKGVCAAITASAVDRAKVEHVKNWLVRFRNPKSKSVGQGIAYTSTKPDLTEGAWHATLITCSTLPIKLSEGVDIAVFVPFENAWPAIFSWKP